MHCRLALSRGHLDAVHYLTRSVREKKTKKKNEVSERGSNSKTFTIKFGLKMQALLSHTWVYITIVYQRRGGGENDVRRCTDLENAAPLLSQKPRSRFLSKIIVSGM